jgi:hypothetical protein
VNIKYTYNSANFIIFSILIIGAVTFFTQADSTDLTLFEDFDGDGLSNGEEHALGTDPRNPDTDGDGYSDGVEVESGYDPLKPAPGDRIIKESTTPKILPIHSSTTNVTRKISENLVSYIADSQEAGDADISSEEFSQAISQAIDEEVEFSDTPPIDVSEIIVKDRDLENLSASKKDAIMKEDAIEYFTSISYIFMTSFPENFFDRSPDELQTELMNHLSDFSSSVNNFQYFEDIAKNALTAEKQMREIAVPEDLVSIHSEGLYLLRYMGDLYEQGDYKKVSTDAAPMIATLAQIQGLINISLTFQEHVQERLDHYEIGDQFLDL